MSGWVDGWRWCWWFVCCWLWVFLAEEENSSISFLNGISSIKWERQLPKESWQIFILRLVFNQQYMWVSAKTERAYREFLEPGEQKKNARNGLTIWPTGVEATSDIHCNCQRVTSVCRFVRDQPSTSQHYQHRTEVLQWLALQIESVQQPLNCPPQMENVINCVSDRWRAVSTFSIYGYLFPWINFWLVVCSPDWLSDHLLSPLWPLPPPECHPNFRATSCFAGPDLEW